MQALDVFRPDQWHDFFITVGGGAAALTGLVFVAIAERRLGKTEPKVPPDRQVMTSVRSRNRYPAKAKRVGLDRGKGAGAISWRESPRCGASTANATVPSSRTQAEESGLGQGHMGLSHCVRRRQVFNRTLVRAPSHLERGAHHGGTNLKGSDTLT
jgi:hypothetical protein